MATLGNQTFLDLELCSEGVSVPSNTVTTDIIDLQITKAASCPYMVVGGEICYTVAIVNNSDIDFDDTGTDSLGQITFRDPLDSNLSYVPDSFTVDTGDGPEPAIPDVTAGVITYDFNIGAGETVLISFCVKVESAPPTITP